MDLHWDRGYGERDYHLRGWCHSGFDLLRMKRAKSGAALTKNNKGYQAAQDGTGSQCSQKNKSR